MKSERPRMSKTNNSNLYLILKYFAFLGLFFFAFSCTRLPNVQGKGETYMQGIWNEDSLGIQKKMQVYTQHRFKFSCDSFYVDFTTRAKVNYYGEECFNKGTWHEYAKGTYEVRNDSLFLAGDFTKSNYKQKISGCYRTGRYINRFIIKAKDSKHINLLNLSDNTTILLNLKEKINCVPQAL